MDDEERWRRRFLLFMGARLFGLALFLGGLAIVFTDVLRPGGWPAVGAVVIVLGLVDAIAVPRLLRRQWKTLDEDEG